LLNYHQYIANLRKMENFLMGQTANCQNCQVINKIINYCIVLTACTAALTFFQNPTLDRESNPHAIIICI
jgi:hypothetical protein